jgi:phospholipid/cholesterol/gamma-HCH transport system ATP-binding protein
MDLIQVENFSKSFGTKVVHDGVNFSVKKGECLGLIGGSGTGKSVLLRSLIGLEKPDSGQIFFDGQSIQNMREIDLVNVRKRVAYVFQGGALFDSMTVFENLAYPLRAHTQLNEDQIQEKIISLLKDFGLAGNESIYPGNLSGGMQKRVGLARSIIMNPEVVLYDEPTAGLDPFNTRRIQEMILQLKKEGRTSILVTHDMPVAFAVCDRIALLWNKKVAFVAETKDLKDNHDNPISRFVYGEVS